MDPEQVPGGLSSDCRTFSTHEGNLRIAEYFSFVAGLEPA
jgi:hypothetical protein